MSVLDDRIEAATARFEAAAQAADRFKNGDKETVITTESGDLPSLSKFINDIQEQLKVGIDGGTF